MYQISYWHNLDVGPSNSNGIFKANTSLLLISPISGYKTMIICEG